MDAPTSSYATAGIALKVSGALKPHHHDKVETPSVGMGQLLCSKASVNFCRIKTFHIPEDQYNL
jgi:hypothetical protein